MFRGFEAAQALRDAVQVSLGRASNQTEMRSLIPCHPRARSPICSMQAAWGLVLGVLEKLLGGPEWRMRRCRAYLCPGVCCSLLAGLEDGRCRGQLLARGPREMSDAHPGSPFHKQH